MALGAVDLWVASKAANARFAVEDGNIIAVATYGPEPEVDANRYAKEYTKATGQTTYVYRVTTEPVRKFETVTEVVAHPHTL